MGAQSLKKKYTKNIIVFKKSLHSFSIVDLLV